MRSIPNIAIVNGFMCAETDEEALEKASGWTFFIFALSYYGRKGVDAPGKGDLWREYQDWRQTDKAQQALRNGLIGSPETIRKRLRLFEEAHVDQVILLNQAGKTTHEDICDSLDLFAQEVMPEFHARQPAQDAWKQDVLAGRIALEDLDTEQYDLYSHQNEDIVRLTPEQLRSAWRRRKDWPPRPANKPHRRRSMRQMVMVGFLQAQNCTNLVSSWRHPESAHRHGSPEYYADLGRVLEEGKFQVAFFDDRLAMPDRYGNDHKHTVENGIRCVKMDPLVVLMVMGNATKRLGLGATRTTTYYEPFDVARAFATIDLMTHGRAAWNVVTSMNDGEALNMGEGIASGTRRPLRSGRGVHGNRHGTLEVLG